MGRQLLIVVEDSGPGVPDAMVPASSTASSAATKAAAPGSASRPRAYAIAHGGELRYERGGAGAHFELVLPAA